MPFVAIPDGVRVVHEGTVDGQPMVMTFGAQFTGVGLTVQNVTDIANRHADAFRAHLLSLFPRWTHTATLAYDLTVEGGAVGVGRLTGATPAQNPNALAVLSACVVVTHKTAKRGRAFTGRTFLGPCAADWVNPDGRTIKSTVVQTIQTNIDAYKAAVDPNLDAAGGRLGVLSRGQWAKDPATGQPAYGVGTPTRPPQVTPVTACVVRAEIGTQRRRLKP